MRVLHVVSFVPRMLVQLLARLAYLMRLKRGNLKAVLKHVEAKLRQLNTDYEQGSQEEHG